MATHAFTRTVSKHETQHDSHRLVAYLISGGNPPGSVFRTFAVDYTAVGGETDFHVTLPYTMADASYAIAVASAGGTSGDGTESSGLQPVPDLPKAGRTTSQFRVLVASPLTAGDELEFTISGNIAV